MSPQPKQVIVSDSFDDLRSGDLRFLEEASKLGEVTVLLWPDDVVRRFTGKPPKFPFEERLYLLNAVRYVRAVVPADTTSRMDKLPDWIAAPGNIWADRRSAANPGREQFCREQNLEYHVIGGDALAGFPAPAPGPSAPGRKKVVVTGCYDWLHSGHVRFFEEASAYGDLHVIVGHDENLRLLKGQGHPLLPEDERRYVVGSIKYVRQAWISSGDGLLDADPEIRRLKPDVYAVNEEGDRGGKREYCERMGIQYVVLKRAPAPGLPARTSTDLRGF